jgi:hypothetical protein
MVTVTMKIENLKIKICTTINVWFSNIPYDFVHNMKQFNTRLNVVKVTSHETLT